MKKRIIFAAAAAIVAAGCTVNDLEKTAPVCEGSSPEFYADLSSVTQETRTYVDSDLNLRWTADDRISIFTNTYNQEYRFTGRTGDNSGSFKKVPGDDFVTGNSTDRNYAVYPYSDDTGLFESGQMTITLPAVQTYAEDTFGLGANTMVAVTSGTDDYFLPFRNLCGYLVVNLYGEAKVKSVSLKGNNSEKISGTAALNPQYGEAPAVTVTSEGTGTVTVDCGDGVTLGTTKETATAFWLVIPPVTFSKGFTITVTDTEGGTMEKSTSFSKSVVRNVKNSMAAFEVKLGKPSAPEHEYVDLGLSVKWATCNIGASKAEEYGKYFAWGDVAGQTWDGSSWSGGGFSSYPEYELDANGNLKPECDAAHVNWGSTWRMPTKAEQEELIESCTSTWTDNYNGTGVAGLIFISNKEGYTDKSIFLPAAGCGDDGICNVGDHGDYWSSTSDGSSTWDLEFGSSFLLQNSFDRHLGFSVRPVYGEYIPVTSISLSDTSVSLTAGSARQLTATYQPGNASLFDMSWSSSNEEVATVSSDGLVTAVGAGQCTVTVSVGTVEAECAVTVTAPSMSHEYVDLGLSVKWATCNIGASKPEEYGKYFSWGDNVGQTRTGSSWSLGGFSTYRTYELDANGNLKAECDAAHANWGGNWRMPTKAEWQELKDNCIFTWTKDYNGTGVAGAIFTSNKAGYIDKSIFLPAAGYGYCSYLYDAGSSGDYWSSTFNSGSYAWYLYFYSCDVGTNGINRYYGFPVRPVTK